MTRVLIDTQVLIWIAEDDSAVSPRALAMIDDVSTVRLASVASIWEMAIKISLNKLILKTSTLRQFVSKLRDNEIELLPITTEDALGVESLPPVRHKDPFDRVIAAQCLRLDLTLVSIDVAFDVYGVLRVW